MTEWTVVLGSASPARSGLLKQSGIAHQVRVSNVDEPEVLTRAHLASEQAAVQDQVRVLSAAKARDVASQLLADGTASSASPAVVIGADSLFEFAGRSWGKPSNAIEVLERWEAMMGGTGTLHTGQTVVTIPGGQESTVVVSVKVCFGEVPEADRRAYALTDEALAVAGAFTLDGLAAAFIDGVDGDPSAVIGLSLPTLRRQLEALGVTWSSLWSRTGLAAGLL